MTDRGTRRQSSAEHNAGDDPSGDTAWDAGAANLAGMSSADSAPPWAMLPTGTLAPDVRQVVFIDSSVPDAVLLAKGVAPGVVAVMLSAGSDGVAQIAAWLASHGAANLSAIDIVSHGQDGMVTLGNATLDSATIGQYSSALATIGAALQPGGDIQLYGCDTAQDAAGDAFLQQLSSATGGAHVAAASHLVGAASDGGSWNLDVNTGAVDAAAPFTSAAMSAYPDELSLTNNQIVFVVGNDESGPADVGNRVEQFGVNGSSFISGSTIDLADGSQSDDSSPGLDYSSSGVAVDTALNEYFVAVDQVTSGNQVTIQKGSFTSGGLSTFYTIPLPNADSGDSPFASVGALALDAQNNELYFAQDAEDSSGSPVAADTGIYKISLSGGGETLVTSTSAGLTNPDYIALDTSANLAFFTDSIFADEPTFPAVDNLDAVNLSTGAVTVLKTFFSNTDSVDLLQGLAVNGNTLYLNTVDYALSDASSSANAILSIPFSVSGSGSTAAATAGAITTLYSGSGDFQSSDIVIDAAHGIFYTTGYQQVNISGEGNGNYAAVFEGSLSGGSSLTEILSMGTVTPPVTVVSNGNTNTYYPAFDTTAPELILLTQPTIVANGTVSYQGPGAPVTLDSGATVSTSDGQEIAGATISVAGGSATDGDILAAAVTEPGITASYNSATEVLTLSGAASAAAYQTEIDSIQFSSTGGAGTTGTRTIDWTVTDGVVSSATATSSVDVICFCAGTKIATPNGEVAVEHLTAGDMVLTASGAVRPIIWVGAGRQLATRGRRTAATPVIVTKNALGPNLPHADLHITKAHALYVDDVLIPVEFLVNHRSIRWDDRAQEVSLYHIELESHDVLLANGAPAESYRDDGNRWLFQNANSGWALPPQEPCAPVLTGGPIVDAAWRRYLEMSGPRKLPPLTDDADLHLMVDGKRVDPVRCHGQDYAFRLPRGCETVRIVSRDAIPAELGLVRDSRPLGVAVRSITLRHGEKSALITAEDHRLTDGFHGYEPADRLRWTNGDAELPDSIFAEFDTAIEIVVSLGGSTLYPLFAEERQSAAA